MRVHAAGNLAVGNSKDILVSMDGLKGIIHAGGVDKMGDISKCKEMLLSAYEMGQSVD